MPEKPQILIDAEVAVNDALAKRHELLQRIEAGKLYMHVDSGNLKAKRLLSELRAREARQWVNYEKLLWQYEQISDEVCGRQWPLEASTHEGMDVRQGVNR